MRNGKVTPAGAEDAYGVVLTAGEVDDSGTERKRAELLEMRRTRSEIPSGQEATLDLSSARRLDDNLVEVTIGDSRVVGCAHCGRLLGDSKSGRLDLARYDGPSSDAGPQVTSDPGEYVDTEVVFRQQCCPGCFTAIYSDIVPVDHPDRVAELAQLIPAVAGR